MLCMALHIAVPVTGGPCYQRICPRANVRILSAVRTRVASMVEGFGHQLSDYTIRLQLHGLRFDAVLPFYRVGLLRILRLVFQCHFQRLPFGSFHQFSFQELCQKEEDQKSLILRACTQYIKICTTIDEQSAIPNAKATPHYHKTKFE